MYFRCLHFVLLGFFLEALNVSGHRETGDCLAPVLEGVFFVPVGRQHIGRKETYPHGATINYSCEEGRKPNTEGWWATSTCQNGIWTQTPQCIDENDCRGPEIPHAQYTSPPYKNGKEITIECDEDEGYRISGTATTTCRNGTWTSPSPICKMDNACTQPDEILNAVIMHDYQTIFPDQKRILYKCEKGYSVAQGKRNSIVCSHGQWSDAECVIDPTPPDPTQPAATVPVPGQTCVDIKDNVVKEGYFYTPKGDDPCLSCICQHGEPETCTEKLCAQPHCQHFRKDPKECCKFTCLDPVERCGDKNPLTDHGVVTRETWKLTYQCQALHKLVGTAEVFCYDDGTWSPIPTCRPDYCHTSQLQLRLTEDKFMSVNQKEWIHCHRDNRDHWHGGRLAEVRCREHQTFEFRRCCSEYERRTYAVHECAVWRDRWTD